MWWSLPDSNRRHFACKANALPTELRPQKIPVKTSFAGDALELKSVSDGCQACESALVMGLSGAGRLLWPSEDHAAHVGLQAGGDDRLDAVPDLVGGIFYDDHGAVF